MRWWLCSSGGHQSHIQDFLCMVKETDYSVIGMGCNSAFVFPDGYCDIGLPGSWDLVFFYVLVKKSCQEIHTLMSHLLPDFGWDIISSSHCTHFYDTNDSCNFGGHEGATTLWTGLATGIEGYENFSLHSLSKCLRLSVSFCRSCPCSSLTCMMRSYQLLRLVSTFTSV